MRGTPDVAWRCSPATQHLHATIILKIISDVSAAPTVTRRCRESTAFSIETCSPPGWPTQLQSVCLSTGASPAGSPAERHAPACRRTLVPRAAAAGAAQPRRCRAGGLTTAGDSCSFRLRECWASACLAGVAQLWQPAEWSRWVAIASQHLHGALAVGGITCGELLTT